jgi:CheY-like chemotaxis protein
MAKPRFYLVIDDDKINNLVCESVIKKVHEENKVLSFLRAEDALEYIFSSKNTNPVDIILLDINMPEMNGWEFLDRYLAQTPKPAHIFILSSSINTADFEKAKLYTGVVDYIVKPFSKEKLAKAIEMLPQ